ncbi:MAG TPA: hypothetical protein VFY93_19410 [Planctomycetota bacterium]|nr:hypothetical protein [Planctomycetota bacterium]
MRPLMLLAVATLLGSLFFATRHYTRREAALPTTRFVTPDAASRAAGPFEAGQLGVALGGYEDLVREKPQDLEAMRGLFRTTLAIGSVGLGQPGIPEKVRAAADTYLRERHRLDPDGTLLQQVARRWVDGRLRVDWYNQAGFYACAATAIFVGARGDPKGPETLLSITNQGNFYLEFFPFARRYHPGWPIVAPLVAHYVENGDLAARVEAGVTLLEYNALFGVGGDLLERHLPAVRDAIREMREHVRRLTSEGASDVGRASILGTALLADRGEQEEIRLLAAAKGERERSIYAPHADTVRIARLWTGLDDFSAMDPLSSRYKELHELDQEIYYLAVAHRVARLQREKAPQEKIAPLLDLLEGAFDGTVAALRIFSMEALMRLDPARGAPLVRRGIDGGGPFAVYAGALAEKLDDPAAVFLPAMSSPQPEVAALAAASLLDLPFPRALQR